MASSPGPPVAWTVDSVATDVEQAFRGMLGSLNAFVVICDPEGRIIWVNHAVEEASGRRLGEASGRHFSQTFAEPADVKALLAGCAPTSDGSHAGRVRSRMAVIGGPPRVVDWSCLGVTMVSGTARGAVLVGVDVTDEERGQQELLDSLDRATLRAEAAEAELHGAEERLERQSCDQRTADAELQYRVAFENLVTTLSTEFIGLKPEEVDQGVERALGRIGEFTGDDRSWVVLYRDDDTMDNTHEWCSSGVASCKPVLSGVPVATSPWCNERLLRWEVVHIPRTEGLPREASIDKGLFQSLGTRSTIIVPMIYRGTTIGSVGFDSVRRERTWSEQTIVLLRTVGEMFVNALERKWVEEELEESRQALSALMGNLPGMAFRLSDDRDGVFEFVSDGCLELTGHKPSDLVQNPELAHLRLVYSSDRPAVRRAVRQALQKQASYHSTHRIVTADGEVKWVMERGRGLLYPRHHTPVLDGFSIDTTDRVLAYQGLELRVKERTREIERRRAVAEGLRVVVEVLNENRPLPEVLDQVAGQASQLLGAPAVALYRLHTSDRMLILQAARGLRTDHAVGSGHLVRRRTATRIAHERHVLAVGEIQAAPADDELIGELEAIHRRSMSGPCRALLFVPIVLADAVYGAMVHFYPASRDFSLEDVELARMLGNQATLAIGNALLRLHAAENAAEQERARIAGDLHDSVTQLMFSANLTAEALPNLLQSDPSECTRSLDQLRSLTTQALAEMRALLLELRPAALEESGLGQVLQSLVAASSGRGRLPIRLTVEGEPDLPEEVQAGIYRVVQEALNNVIRHSGARSAEVTLRCDLRGVSVQVVDDGKGFDLEQVPPGHMGLAIMRERAAAIDAHLSIDPAPRGGTRVCVRWSPFSKGRQE